MSKAKRHTIELSEAQVKLVQRVLSDAILRSGDSTTRIAVLNILEPILATKQVNGVHKEETALQPKILAVTPLPRITDAQFAVLELLEEIGGKGTAYELHTTVNFLQAMYDIRILDRKIFAGQYDYFLTSLGTKTYQNERALRYGGRQPYKRDV